VKATFYLTQITKRKVIPFLTTNCCGCQGSTLADTCLQDRHAPLGVADAPHKHRSPDA